MTTIQNLFGFNVPEQHCYKDVAPLKTSDPSRLYGVELEIEGIVDLDATRYPGFTITNDGSLRNHGHEYISKPMTFSNLVYGLTGFFERNKFTEANYSERCSVHVHVNCLDLTMDQVKTVCLLYQTFERFFFMFAGAERDKNIFCVPWYETTLTADALTEDDNLRNWQKYTALNLLPLWEQGTIEFRHMPGTNDLEKITNWINLIGCLFAYALKHPFEETEKTIIGLNTSSQYDQVLQNVFMDWAPLFMVPDYKLVLEEGVLNTKFLLMEKYNKEKKPVKPPVVPRVRPTMDPATQAMTSPEQVLREANLNIQGQQNPLLNVPSLSVDELRRMYEESMQQIRNR